jgi:hypothetical protein
MDVLVPWGWLNGEVRLLETVCGAISALRLVLLPGTFENRAISSASRFFLYSSRASPVYPPFALRNPSGIYIRSAEDEAPCLIDRKLYDFGFLPATLYDFSSPVITKMTTI